MRRTFSRFYPHFAPAALFAVVDDIESYPSFVPFCLGARILSREGADSGACLRRVANVFGAGRLRLSFVTEAQAAPPRELAITSREGDLRAFRALWRFQPRDGGCLMTCDLTLEFASMALNAVAPLIVGVVAEQVIAAFERRAALNKRIAAS